MSSLLYIQASPRLERSHSIAVADAFVQRYAELHPQDSISKFNLFHRDLPKFDGLALQAKYTIMHGGSPSPEEKAAWTAVEEIIAEFKAADKYVLAVPMWNFMIPYQLKHYLDLLCQPTYTFNANPDGSYEGLVTGPVLLAMASGGEYPPGSPAEAIDFRTAYMKFILGFIGLTDVRMVQAAPTLAGGPEVADARRRAAIAKAVEMAGEF